MSDDYVDEFDEDSGLIDQKAIQDILERAADALRGLGLTINLQEVAVTIQQGQTYALIPAIIRPSAKKKLVEDVEAREQFNQMMANDNENRIKSEAEKIFNIANDPKALEAFLYGDDDDPDACAHETVHEGLCLGCSQEINSE